MPTLAKQIHAEFARRHVVQQYSRLLHYEFARVRYSRFVESEHPRDEEGQFTDKGGGSSAGKSTPSPDSSHRKYPDSFSKYQKRSARVNAAEMFAKEQTRNSATRITKEFASSAMTAIISVSGNMNSVAFHSLMQNVDSVQFTSPEELQSLANAFNPGGIWSSAEKAVHINPTVKGDFNIEGIAAHEFGHAIDHNPESFEERISDSREWNDAFAKEIDTAGDPLSSYARKSPREGFAEFCRLVWTTGSKRQAHDQFPKCWRVLKKYGMVGTP